MHLVFSQIYLKHAPLQTSIAQSILQHTSWCKIEYFKNRKCKACMYTKILCLKIEETFFLKINLLSAPLSCATCHITVPFKKNAQQFEKKMRERKHIRNIYKITEYRDLCIFIMFATQARNVKKYKSLTINIDKRTQDNIPYSQ